MNFPDYQKNSATPVLRGLPGGEASRPPRGLFVAVDVLLLLLALAIAAVTVLVFGHTDFFSGIGKEKADVTTVWVLEPLDKSLTNTVKIGQTVFDFESGEALGTVTAFAVRTTKGGQERLELTMTLRADYKEGKGYFAGTRLLMAGQNYCLRLDGFVSEALCLSVGEQGGENE